MTAPDVLDATVAAELLPRRPVRGHKGTFGRLLVVAGSIDHLGAALLAGIAALRAGTGLVTLCVPASLQPLAAGRVPELMTFGLPERSPFQVDPVAAAELIAAMAHDAIVIGPGLLPGPATASLVRRVLGQDAGPAVVDAQAINELARMPGWQDRTRRRCVLTPHPGELARLQGAETGEEDRQRLTAARVAVDRSGQVVVLKGARTVIAAPDGRLSMSPFELPVLATAGSGDVLAGVVGALLAQGLAPFEAACLGVFLHARAAMRVGRRVGDAGMLASELAAELPRARGELARLTPQAAR